MPCLPFPVPYQAFFIPFRQIRLEGAPVGGLPGPRRASYHLTIYRPRFNNPYLGTITVAVLSIYRWIRVLHNLIYFTPYLPPLFPVATNDKRFSSLIGLWNRRRGIGLSLSLLIVWTLRYVIDPLTVRSLTPCGKDLPPGS